KSEFREAASPKNGGIPWNAAVFWRSRFAKFRFRALSLPSSLFCLISRFKFDSHSDTKINRHASAG
ncbi:MAG TPA: hypothetical protein VHF05_01610, partial [Candidatus Paceibacterota bacterium]|nr:hypothetical protein [Candidatus Paceibacterota bacterium]